MIKAVIFDMDGVIINSEPLHKKAYQMMFKEFNLNVSDELYGSFTGMATLPICEKLCAELSLNLSPELLVKTKRKHFKSLFKNGYEFKLIDGVLKLIQHYKQNGITLVLASSASMDNINMIFEKLLQGQPEGIFGIGYNDPSTVGIICTVILLILVFCGVRVVIAASIAGIIGLVELIGVGPA